MELPTYADTALGYPRYIDVMSFVDGILLSELAKNVDSYRLSTFFHKDRDSKGGKLVMGPLWDFNHAFGNCDYYDGAVIEGFQLIYLATSTNFHAIDGGGPAFWWKKLFEEPGFAALMEARWGELRSGVLSDAAIAATIDSLTGMVSEAQARNLRPVADPGYLRVAECIRGADVRAGTAIHETMGLEQARLDGRGLRRERGDTRAGQTGLPEQIVLDQNYPNPFNAGQR